MTFLDVLSVMSTYPNGGCIMFSSEQAEFLDQNLESFEIWMLRDIQREYNIRKIIEATDWRITGIDEQGDLFRRSIT